MKKELIALAIAIAGVFTAHAQDNKPPLYNGQADLIVYDAKVTTQNPAQPEAQAVAVKAGRIYAVGTDAEILELKDSNTKLIDANGRRLVPGLNDAHIHVNMEGQKFNYSLRWEGVPSLKIALQMLSEQAKRTPKGQWVRVVAGWAPDQFVEKRMPTMAELKKACPDRPFIVQYAYTMAYLNDLAMQSLGVGKQKFWEQLPFTEWEKDKKGNFTGIVRGNPGSIIFWTIEGFMVPQPTLEVSKNSLQQFVYALNSFGLTSIIDAGSVVGYPKGHTAIQSLVKDNALNLRFGFMDIGEYKPDCQGCEIDEQLKNITKTMPVSVGQNMSPFMAHGYEYEGAGEAITTSLLDFENFDKPALVLDKDFVHKTIIKEVSKLVEKRIPFRIHCSYNENISAILDALEDLNKTMPFDGLRWAIEHAEFVSPENIQRIKALGGGIAIQDKLAFQAEVFEKTYGKARAGYAPPIKELIASGIPLALGTDGPRGASYNPWVSMYWATTGKSIGGIQLLSQDNVMSRAEALKLYTLGSAWFQQQEKEKGRIAPGNLADFALLSSDYFTVPDEEIKNISSVLTVLDGKVVYGNAEYQNIAPQRPQAIPSWSPINYYGTYYNKK